MSVRPYLVTENIIATIHGVHMLNVVQHIDDYPRSRRGLHFQRLFSTPERHPFEEVQWVKRSAIISGEKGKEVFRQDDVEVPEFWSQMATNVVASKYFRGRVGAPERESSVKQLIGRVVETIASWGKSSGYFDSSEDSSIFSDELTAILVHQFAAFNSPVWFNLGIEREPQCSACFILSVNDTMESLLDLQKTEGMLFKFGSGAGTNFSAIRSRHEIVNGGGVPSGPVSFLRGYDAWASTIKSGGKTRRAAKMQILNVDHPDIIEFIGAKHEEEKKAWALIEEGYDGAFNVPGGAYDSVFFQNSNFSVRVTDEFMSAAEAHASYATRCRVDGSTHKHLNAHDVLTEIAQGTWACGDPGLQFDTMINKWNTCANSGRINASNPCSEYMHLDDSACNLASLNLLRFISDEGDFQIDKFTHAIDILITAQDILVDHAGYPTKKIGDNAKRYRELGLGFANLGALLMTKGLAYDSDEGRAYAGAIMALLCGQAYATSVRLAEALGAFAGFDDNRAPMLQVLAMHRDAALVLSDTSEISACAKNIWNSVVRDAKRSGVRNSQTTVLAPTGTIAFLMDCDTTGVEPDIALVKYKKLVGGGVVKIVNNEVDRALRNLGYSAEERAAISAHIEKTDTIEGAPGIHDDHLAIFDCAFKAVNGRRSIHYGGHLKMMAALQPFVSGAISKTVNMPEHSTVQDIYDTYLEAWKLGLKAVAIYRDNSKRSQPLTTTLKESGTREISALSPAQRRRLPDERHSLTHRFNIAGHEGYITVGLYPDGWPGEIFIVMAKEGSTLSGVMDAFATSVSIALQYGVPLSVLVKKFSHMRFEPSGMTENPQVPFAKSIMDYIFRWLGSKFLSAEEQKALGILSVEQKDIGSSTDKKDTYPVSTNGIFEKLLPYVSDDAPPCSICGSSLMVRQGACYRCLNCGSQGGCG